MKLVIVESPAKAKTIERFLGSDYAVKASSGHVRDLPRSAAEMPSSMKGKPWARHGVDTKDSYRPFYIVPPESRRFIAPLREALSKADELLLATDEDREGEAISWHLVEVLKPRVPVRRIVFHEITRPAIEKALASPRNLDDRLVRAQEARRVLDRLFGYELSPVLWKKVKPKLSAGRVQSVALRLVVEREEERLRFKASEYWRVVATLSSGGEEFTARLVEVGGRTVATARDFDSTTGAFTASSRAVLLGPEQARTAASGALEARPWRVSGIERKSVRQAPRPPFTTSTLQQAASGRLRMSPSRTMRVAQRLYEGIDLGGGDREGLITYMRTDSVTLSEKALRDAGAHIRREYGKDDDGRPYHAGPRRYRTKSKGAQEAHEAIRPTEISRTPASMRHRLDRDQHRLYELIWNRTVASQMADARIDRTTIHLTAAVGDPDGRADHVFRANGSVLRFPGYLRVWREKRSDQRLPNLREGGLVPSEEPAVSLESVEPERRETRPPPRYSEAALVRKLEKEGIGRPSTYAPTLSTLRDREYVEKRKSALVPTFIGFAVNRLLRAHFEKYVSLDFTAHMEGDLDGIAAGSREYRSFLDAFYRGDGRTGGIIRDIEEQLPEIEYFAMELGACPDSGAPIRVRIGRNSAYLERPAAAGVEKATATIPDELLIDELTVARAHELLADAARRVNIRLGDDAESGKTVSLRKGPFGFYVQLGEAGRDKSRKPAKPRRASIPKGMDPADVTLQDALKLLSLPRSLGTDPETGLEVTARDGPFGPYVKRGAENRSLASLSQAFTVTLAEALELLAQKKAGPRRNNRKVLKSLGPHPETGAAIQLLEGRYGPYVTDGASNGSLPKGREPQEVTVEEAVGLLAQAAARKKARGGKPARGRRRKAPRKKGAAGGGGG